MRIRNRKGIKVSDIYIMVRCAECDNHFNIKCRGSITMKNCKCNNGTFIVTLKPVKKYVVVDVVFKGSNYEPKFIEPVGYSIGIDGDLIIPD